MPTPRWMLFALLFAQLLLVPCGLAATGFEGIAWGSPPEQIEEKFGEVAERDDELCNDQDAAAALADQGEDCLLVRVDHYFANGVAFSLAFRFDSEQRGLRTVVLKSNIKSKNLSPNAVKRVQQECAQNYERISRRLSGEYGTPLPARQVGGEPEATFLKADHKAWTAQDTGVWMRRSYGYTDHWRRWRKADGCEIEIRYFSIPVASQDAVPLAPTVAHAPEMVVPPPATPVPTVSRNEAEVTPSDAANPQ